MSPGRMGARAALAAVVCAVGLLAGALITGAPEALAAAPCGTNGQLSQSGTIATCTYTSQGTEDTFAVPNGVGTVSVTGIGAPGGPNNASEEAGLGAQVVNTGLPVAAGSPLWVDVGQAGPPRSGGLCFSPPLAGGLFDGGGASQCAGGGGGASALLTAPRASAHLTGDPATDSRLLVAGGGGGVGTGGGTEGGNAGVATVTGAGNASCSFVGAGDPGGIGPIDGTAGGGAGCGGGASGTASSGGDGSKGGGGGGGGWFGGGGGGFSAGQGAGGGGSSYGGAGRSAGISIATASSSDVPKVVISYTVPPPTASITTPVNGASYVQGQVVHSSFSCTEAAGGTGIKSCQDQNGNPSGTAIDTSTPGPRTFTVTATSNDGLTNQSSVTYTVIAPPTAVTGVTTLPPPLLPPPVLSGLAAVHRCVTSAVLEHAHAGSGGLAFSFTLSQTANVTFAVLHRVGSPAWTKCPSVRGHTPSTYRSVGEVGALFPAGQQTGSLGTAARATRSASVVRLTPGRHRISLAQIAQQRLPPGTYVLSAKAVNSAGQASGVDYAKFWVFS